MLIASSIISGWIPTSSIGCWHELDPLLQGQTQMACHLSPVSLHVFISINRQSYANATYWAHRTMKYDMFPFPSYTSSVNVNSCDFFI